MGIRALESLGSAARIPKATARDAAIVIGGRVVAFGATVEEYTELLDMLGIIGEDNEAIEQENQQHDYQSKYRHYRNIGVA